MAVFLLTKSFSLVPSRVTKSENFPDSKIFVAKTFQIKRVKMRQISNARQIRLKSVFANFKHKHGSNMPHRVHF